MKRGYYQKSRSKSHERQHKRRSGSRSRDKNHKKHSTNNSSRQKIFRSGLGKAKVQSDIKNHFRFKLPNLSTKEQQDTLTMLKSKLNDHIGPVEHITRSKQTMIVHLGFKYDIDAISFLQTGGLTVKTTSHKVQLQPIPTKAFEYILDQKKREAEQKQRHQRKSKQSKSHQNKGSNYYNHKRKSSKSKSKSKSRSRSRSRSISYSSSSSSGQRQRQRHGRRSHSKQKQQRTIKLQIYGIPAYLNDDKIITVLNQFQGGHKINKFSWRNLSGSICQYLQIRVDPEKADKLIDNCNKLQLDGRPIVVIEETQRPGKALSSFQVQIQFPKAVHPSKVLKSLYPFAKIVQLVANQQIQQDGKCKGYIVTVNDPAVVTVLKKIGDLNNGIHVSEPKSGQYVYRPTHLLPTRHQL